MTEHASQPPPLPQEPPQAPPKGGGGGKLAIIIIACVVVVVTIGSLGLAILMSSLKKVRAKAYVAACQSNLKGMGTATLAYQEQSYDYSLPLIKSREAVAGGANSAPTEANRTDSEFGERGAPADELSWEVLGDQAMQNVWLLVADNFVDDEIFRCRGDRDWQPRSGVAKYGWTDPRQYSYGMQWPYLEDATGNANAAPLGAPYTVMLADRSPGGPAGKSRPPSNHPKNGTNVLLASGGVKYDTGMISTIGYGGDEIYTNAAGEAGGLPQSATDTSIALSGR